MNFDKIKKAITQSVLDVKSAPFVREMCKACSNMYRLGWDERNGGNISRMIDENELEKYLDTDACLREIPMGFKAEKLAGRCFSLRARANTSKTWRKTPKTTSASSK